MLAIAGAILINAACILITSGGDTTDVYALSRILIAIGALLMGLDFVVRFRDFAKRSKAEHMPSTSKAAEPGATTHGGGL